MQHKHSILDCDPRFSINPITRAIKNEASKKTTLIQYDHNSERFGFELPRYIEGHDMTLCNKVEVHYNNIGGEGQTNPGVYEVDDLQISPDDTSMVVFSWLIKDNATQLVGQLAFLVKFCCEEDGVVTYAWHTAICDSIAISNGISNGDAVAERYPDILAQWRNELFGISETEQGNIVSESQAQQEAIRATGEAVKASIPVDYSALTAKVDGIDRTRAVAIVGNAEGENILLSDSAEMPLLGLNVFGKSTQDGTPTPDNPQDINSVDSPTITVGEKSITIPHTLHGIPVTSGGNYTDADGQQWLCDEIDLARGVKVQRCGYYIFDGSSDEAWNGIYTHDDKNYVHIKVPRGSEQYTTPLFCNYGTMASWARANICFINNFTEFVVGGEALQSALSSLAAFKSRIAISPIALVYLLETPIETALTEAEITAFKALATNYPSTTVLNDSGAFLTVKYGIDTKAYIDNKALTGIVDEELIALADEVNEVVNGGDDNA